MTEFIVAVAIVITMTIVSLLLMYIVIESLKKDLKKKEDLIKFIKEEQDCFEAKILEIRDDANFFEEKRFVEIIHHGFEMMLISIEEKEKE